MHSEVPDDRIFSLHGCLCMRLWASIPLRHGWDRAFSSSHSGRDSHMLWDTCVNVSACLANIQCATAFTRELIHNMWSQSNGNPASKWKETRKAIRGAELNNTYGNIWRFSKFKKKFKNVLKNKRKV
jgi:hypothetical protein